MTIVAVKRGKYISAFATFNSEVIEQLYTEGTNDEQLFQEFIDKHTPKLYPAVVAIYDVDDRPLENINGRNPVNLRKFIKNKLFLSIDGRTTGERIEDLTQVFEEYRKECIKRAHVSFAEKGTYGIGYEEPPVSDDRYERLLAKLTEEVKPLIKKEHDYFSGVFADLPSVYPIHKWSKPEDNAEPESDQIDDTAPENNPPLPTRVSDIIESHMEAFTELAIKEGLVKDGVEPEDKNQKQRAIVSKLLNKVNELSWEKTPPASYILVKGEDEVPK